MNAADALTRAVQVAGVRDAHEAAMLVAAGVDFLGFPLRLRDGREDLGEAHAAAIIAQLPRTVHAVAITYLERAADVIDLCATIGVRWVQLHAEVARVELVRLRELRPELNVIKSLIVRDANLAPLIQMVDDLSPCVDAFITDTFDPATGRTGATGKRHDFAISREIVRRCARPIILAGGLDPANVEEAIASVAPAAVDAHTRLEDASGAKDPVLVHAFVAAAHRGFARAGSSRFRAAARDRET
jgi:phosphoribosylanthranilate isomerase